MPLGPRLAALALVVASLPAAVEPVRFNRDIRPILAEHCFRCHGPDPGSRKAKLRLDREDGLFGDRDGGAPVVRGKPDESQAWRRITTADDDDVMPPPKEHKPLDERERELVRRWIAQGAPFEPHWSLIKPQLPPAPTPRDARWARNDIDRFVLAKLDSVDLKPAPEADRRALARRLSFDLTGLPPDPDEVDAFVADRSPDAYEKLVDRWLASPRYGEHRARYWLDAARYGDTHGMHFDNYREMWAFRDWVIAAFNRDEPFDQFTVEQLAGDLLPNATREQRVATGFHRCNITTNEGGTIEAENLANYARDRAETTSWVWLGMTANCAVCHDHKFDPITQRDFYALTAYFRNTTQSGLDGNVKDTAPTLMMPTPEDEKRLAEIAAALPGAKQAVDDAMAGARGRFDAWLAALTPESWRAALDADGAPDLRLPLDAAAADGGFAGTLAGAAVGGRGADIAWQPIGGFAAPRFAATSDATLDVAPDLSPDAPYAYGAWVMVPEDFHAQGALLSRMDEGDGYRGWDLWIQGDQFAAHLINHWSDDAIKVRSKAATVKRGTWQHVFVAYDGSRKAAGLRLYVDGAQVDTDVEADALKTASRTTAPLKLARRKNGDIVAGAALRDVRVYARAVTSAAIARLALADRVAAWLAQPADQRPAADRDAFFAALGGGDDAVAKATAARDALVAEDKTIRARSPVTHVMQEKDGSTPKANVLYRGNYDQPREEVEPAGFSFLHPMPEGAPKNRLGLARWIVSVDDPLMPRVIVNRYWQELFGTGIVRTAEDFGVMGEPPSHPELLDWLACEFRDGGWDVKKLIRLMVTSATYRQAAVATPEKLEKDPQDRLLSRGPRFRLDAEMIRDAALAWSGLLSAKIGGPSVKPYQPDGVWEAVGMRESDTKSYVQDHGESLYRRSLYTFWKRQAPPASMEVLNAPSRETACLRRERTDTPLQALVTLDDVQFVEAARVLASHALTSGADDAAHVQAAARRVLSRPLADDELAIARATLDAVRARYRAHPDEAAALVAVGETKADPAQDAVELASLALVCSQLMNLDEALTK